jgi:hypothetical protein
MRWVGSLVVLVGLCSAGGVHAAPTATTKPELPIAIASFPVDAPAAPSAPDVAVPPAPAVAAPPSAAGGASPAPTTPARTPPVPTTPASLPAPLMPAPAAVAPVPVMPAPAVALRTPTTAVQVAPAPPVNLEACPVPRSATDFAAVAIGILLRDAGSLFAALQAVAAPSDAQEIQEAADMQIRRITFMRQLAAERDQADQHEFDEKLSLYLRKRAFLQNLESRRSTATR